METKNTPATTQIERHNLWLLLSSESDRDGYALRPLKWEGPGEYQRVSTPEDDFGYLVKVK